MTIYEKIMGISEYTLKLNEISKINNLISSDLNILENGLKLFFLSFQTPIKIIGVLLVFALILIERTFGSP